MGRGLRQVDVAQALGAAQTTIANYEKNLRFPDERMLGRIADFFGVSLDYLLGRRETAFGEAQGTAGRASEPLFGESARQYLGLLLAHREREATELVEASVRGGLAVPRVYLDVLEPALKETGRLWQRGELSVGEEHAVSLATQRIMSRIVDLHGASIREPTPPRCLVLLAPSEQHAIGPTMVSDLLRLDGWEARFPGGNLSIGQMVEMALARPPQLLAISATIAANAAAAADLVAAIRGKDSLRGTRIVVGGQAIRARRHLWQEMGADGTADDGAQAVAAANRLVGRAGVQSPD